MLLLQLKHVEKHFKRILPVSDVVQEEVLFAHSNCISALKFFFVLVELRLIVLFPMAPRSLSVSMSFSVHKLSFLKE